MRAEREAGPSVKSLLWTRTATVLGRRGGVTCQHAHHRQEDLLHTLHGAPALGAALVAHGVVARSVQDGDADSAIWVDCGAGHAITSPTKVHLVKAVVFPVVIYGCESWTVKKAEC